MGVAFGVGLIVSVGFGVADGKGDGFGVMEIFVFITLFTAGFIDGLEVAFD